MALSSTVTLLPSGARSTISSARTVSPMLSSSAMGDSRSENSRPSARRKVSTSSRSSSLWSGLRRLSPILRASRLEDLGNPVWASKTTTPTGEVLISVSRSALARRSSRWRRALAMAMAAWEANIISVSSSSWLNSWPPFLLRQVNAAHPLSLVPHRERQEGHPLAHLYRRLHLGQPQRPDVAQQVGHPQGGGNPAQVLEVLLPARNPPHPLSLLGGHARGEELTGDPVLVVQGDDAVSGGRQRPGAVHHLL